MNKSAASRRFDKESTQNLNNKEIFYGKLLFLFSDENIVLSGQYIPLHNKIILQTSDVPFLYPQKTSENQRFSVVFRVYINGTLAWNHLILSMIFCLRYAGKIIPWIHKSVEAVVRRCSVKKIFLKISRNSQENTCPSPESLL